MSSIGLDCCPPLFNLRHNPDLKFCRSNIQFAISHTMVLMPWNVKETYWLEAMPNMRPWIFILSMTLPRILGIESPVIQITSTCMLMDLCGSASRFCYKTINLMYLMRCWFDLCAFQMHLSHFSVRIKIFITILFLWMMQDPKNNISLCNGLVPSGNKQLPASMLAQIADVIWRHYVVISLKFVWNLL